MAPALLPPPLLLMRILLSSDADALLPYARAALDAQDAESGTWIARRAAALAPEKPWPYVALSVLAGDAAGVSLDRRLLRLAPDDDQTVRRLAQRLAALPDGSAAVRGLKRTLVDDPADPTALYVLGVLGVLAGDPTGAPALARAVRLRPHRRGEAYSVGVNAAGTGHVAVAAALNAALGAVGPPPAVLDRAPAWPLDLVAAVKAGASLASVMIPDPRSPANNPEYLENYCFDQVIASERCFWAIPQPLIYDPAGASFGGFAYCGDTRLFLRYNTGPGPRAGAPLPLMLYPGEAYRHFEFVVRHDHTPVYDSAAPAEVRALEAAIRAGAPMRVVVDTGDGLVQSLPVNLCFLYRESGAVQVTTDLRHAPEICLTPVESLWPYMSSLIETHENRATFIEMLIPGHSRLLVRRLVMHSDGWCDGIEADGTVRRRPCPGFRVFARL
ncbi:MAG TPA: hypothetical protein VD860_08500 [Azospirillum sp.]|nr:hypothetical protein [Azospirillum sp.]